jgi:radical SAM superfamily enzyme YgiQ (UPF0313 family)
MTEDLIKLMKDSGCVGLCYGLESGSQRILNEMNKKVTLDQYRKAIRLNQKYFDYQDYTFIVGMPSETSESVRESINFCKEMNITPSAVFYMTPYPGTPLFNSLILQDDIHPTIDTNNLDEYEKYVLSLGEQGEQLIWNLTDFPDNQVIEWHDTFIEETNAWNKMKHGDKIHESLKENFMPSTEFKQAIGISTNGEIIGKVEK